MKNRKLLLVVSLVLALTMSLGGTLAYLTDTEEAVNVMTLGNVDIEQNEIGADGNPFEQGQPLYPAYPKGDEMVGTVVKKVSVENTGSSDAHIRTWIAFEAGEYTNHEDLEALIKITFDESVKGQETWLPGVYEIDGQQYCVAYFVYDAVEPDAIVKSLESFYMVSAAGNKEVAQFGNTYEVLVLSQAVQTNNFVDAAEALTAAFGDNHPWVGKDIAELPTTVVATAAELKAALEKGGNVLVTSDITLEKSVEVPAGVKAILNMNGHTVKGTMHKNDGSVIKNNGNLTINGGTVSSTADNGGSAIMNKGTLVVNGATLNGAPNADSSWPSYAVNNTGYMVMNDTAITSVHGGVASYNQGAVAILNNCKLAMSGIPGFTSHGFYTYSDGKIVINGGTYANNANDQAASGASVINGAVEINAGTFSGRIENYYGTPVIKGGNFDNNPARFVDKTSTSTENGNGTWSVNAAPATGVSTGEDLQEELNNGKDIVFASDIEAEDVLSNGYGSTGINVNGQTLDGNGKILSVPGATGTWDSAIAITGGTIKNLTIDAGFRGVFIKNGTERVYLENVTVDGSVYTISCDQAGKQGLTATNSTFNGWTSYAGTIGDVVFNNCNFGDGAGYNFSRPYAPTTYVNCNFAEKHQMDPRAAVTFENCTIGGKALTAENLATLVVDNIANASVK